MEIACQGVEDPLEDAVIDPALKPPMTRLIGRIPIGQVLPRRARAQDPQNPVQHVARIAPRPPAAIAPQPGFRQERFQDGPLRVSEVHAVEYDGDRNFVPPPCFQGL